MDKSPDWNESWDRITEFQPIPDTDDIPKFLDQFTSSGTFTRSAIEIGCFPGGFIDHIASRGYTVSGIDTYPGVTKLDSWLRGRGRSVGTFMQASLSEYSNLVYHPYYDLVMSLGLIEHFTNFCDVIYDHAQLCNNGSRLIIGAPNFASPFQRALHSFLDKDNFEKHVLESMYPKVWALYLTALGFKIDYCGPVGKFSFWSGTRLENQKAQQLQQLVSGVQGYIANLGDIFNERESGYVAVVASYRKELPPRSIQLDSLCMSLAKDLSDKDQKLSDLFTPRLKEMCK